MLILKKERDKNFMRVCSEVETELLQKKRDSGEISHNRRKKIVSLYEILTAALQRQADSFYITDILKLYWKVRAKPELLTDTPHGQLYRDIARIFLALRRDNPEYNNRQIAEIVELLPAPQFYISFNTAKIIYYEHHRKN